MEINIINRYISMELSVSEVNSFGLFIQINQLFINFSSNYNATFKEIKP